MSNAILAQHKNIDQALLEIDGLLEEARASRRLGTSIAEFAGNLQAHFDYEEQSYLFTGFVEDYPRFARQIELLRAEHAEMLAEIRSIIEEMEELHPDVVAMRIRAVMTRLGLHESHEIDLLQQAHTDDIPMVD